MGIQMRMAARAVVWGFVVCAATVAGAQDLPDRPLSLADGRVRLGAEVAISAPPQADREGAWFNYTTMRSGC